MELNQSHKKWMLEAFREAEKAFNEGEVPVGAVVVLKDRIIGKGFNRIEALQDATAHAEILAQPARKTLRIHGIVQTRGCIRLRRNAESDPGNLLWASRGRVGSPENRRRATALLPQSKRNA